MSVFGVILVGIFPHMDTFHAVLQTDFEKSERSVEDSVCFVTWCFLYRVFEVKCAARFWCNIPTSQSFWLIGLFILMSNFHCAKSVEIRSYFWSVFSSILTKYRKLRTRNNSAFGHFSRSVCF